MRSALQRGRTSVLPHHCTAMPARGVSEPKAMAASAHLAGHVKVHEDDIKGVRPAPLQNDGIGLFSVKCTRHLQGQNILLKNPSRWLNFPLTCSPS